jgi:hypothetical protein
MVKLQRANVSAATARPNLRLLYRDTESFWEVCGLIKMQ